MSCYRAERSSNNVKPFARTMNVGVIAATGLVLLAAACGGSPAGDVSQLGTTATQSGAVAFARCMRADGVPNWPDPNTSGVFDKSKLSPQQLGASTSRVQAAQRACQHLLPNGGGSTPTPAQVQRVKALGLAFSRCVRSHGLPNFPDPAGDGRIPDPASVGIDQGSPKFQAANQACRKYRPPYMPSNAAYNAYVRTHG
jgi:hypothetical protein